MSLDSIFLKGLTAELDRAITGAKIEKVLMPARGSLVFGLKAERRISLFVGGSSGSARIHLTNQEYEKPVEPPMFCMLLRKHLVGARVLSVRQPELDRVLELRLQAPGMFGEGEERTLIVELLGRTANVILTDGEGVITDCLYRQGSIGEKRMVLPGMLYRLPPRQEKTELSGLTEEGIRSALVSAGEGNGLDRFLVGAVMGLSPLVARELCWRAYSEASPRVFDVLAKDGGRAITGQLMELKELTDKMELRPYMVLTPEKLPFEYSYLPIFQYGPEYELKQAASFSELLETFSGRRDEEERRRQRSRELTKTVRNTRERVARRLSNQREELKRTENREYLRQCGDIITSNLHTMNKGMYLLRAYDYYSEDGGEREIRLDPLKTPQQNAAKYYKDYNRAKSAETHLTEQICAGEEELSYLDSVLDELSRAENERELNEIRAELLYGGYLRETKGGKKEKRQISGPMRFKSDSGFYIHVGRNNTQNDALTLKNSAKTDLWLHAQKIHGSHVVVSCNGESPDERTVMQAASLAAYFSQGRDSGKVPVDYTLVKFVKKPNGARPGMVIYTDYRTVLAEPDEQLSQRLRVK
ncbi:MAG: NFACT family protein [Oscillospiraceae bacterium]